MVKKHLEKQKCIEAKFSSKPAICNGVFED